MHTLFHLGIGSSADQLPKAVLFYSGAVRRAEFTIGVVVLLVTENVLSLCLREKFVWRSTGRFNLVQRLLVLDHCLAESICVLPKSSLFVSHMAILTVEVIQGLTVNVEQRLFNLQIHISLHLSWNLRRNIILNRDLIYLSNNLIFRWLWKCLIYQAFLRAPVHLETPCLETFLFIGFKGEFGGSLTHIIAHESPCIRVVYIWTSHTLRLLFHDIRAALCIFIQLKLTIFCFKFFFLFLLWGQDLGKFRFLYINLGFWLWVSQLVNARLDPLANGRSVCSARPPSRAILAHHLMPGPGARWVIFLEAIRLNPVKDAIYMLPFALRQGIYIVH